MEVAAVSSLAPVTAVLLPQVPAAPAPSWPPGAASNPGPSLPPELEITYDFDRELHQIMFTLRRPDTGEVVRQVPPQAVREFAVYLLHQAARALDVTR